MNKELQTKFNVDFPSDVIEQRDNSYTKKDGTKVNMSFDFVPGHVLLDRLNADTDGEWSFVLTDKIMKILALEISKTVRVML